MAEPPCSLSLAMVPPEEYQQFADALCEFRPHSYQVEAMLRGYLRYDHFCVLGTALYAPTHALHRHHLAVVVPSSSGKDMDSFSIYWNHYHLSDADVLQLLRSLPVLSWTKPVMIRQIPSHLLPKMDAIMLELSGGALQLLAPIPVTILSLAAEDASPQPKLPAGYYFGTLTGSHGEEVMDSWIDAPTEAVEEVSIFLDKLPSAGVFYNENFDDALSSKKGNQSDELVSYSAYKLGSDLGMTFTKENHRRKKLAQAVTLQLARRIHDEGLPVTVVVDQGHEVSMNMHMSMGFNHYTDVNIPLYFPKNFDLNSIPNFMQFAKLFPESLKTWEETRKTE